MAFPGVFGATFYTDRMSLPRLIPDIPLPPYAFVPGRHPHPESDPAGHSYGRHPAPATLDPARWQDSREYLFGLDLFNADFYWEAHVQWEALWQGAGRKGTVADFAKGLIQLAAAGVKHAEGMPDGVRGHARRAAELFRGLGERDFCGLRLPDLAATADGIARQGWAAFVLRPGESAA
jgi:hypothetical protein